jgi:uncharacterized membrane protein
MVDVTTSVQIARPAADVAAFACDPDNVPAWYAKITSVEWESPRPVEVGTRLAFVARFLGRTLRYTYVIRELTPGQRLVMSSDQGPFPMETTYTFTGQGTGTEMVLRNRGNPPGFAKLLAPVLSAAVRRANRKDLDRLKTVLEEGIR